MERPKGYFERLERLRKKEVAEMLGVSIKTVYNYVKNLGLPICRQEGKFPHFLASEINKWLEPESRKIQPPINRASLNPKLIKTLDSIDAKVNR